MICTFGDTTDVVWWRELALPVRALVGRDGRMLPAVFGEAPFESDDAAAARSSTVRDRACATVLPASCA